MAGAGAVQEERLTNQLHALILRLRTLVSILCNLWQACGTSAPSLHKLVSKPGSSHLRDFQHCSPSDWSRQFSPKRTDSISRGNHPRIVNKDQFPIWSFQRRGIKSWSPPGPSCYCGQGCLLRSSESGSYSTLSIYFPNGAWCLPVYVYTLCGVQILCIWLGVW